MTFVPRPWAVRQALEAWGPQPSAWPLLVEKPGRTKDKGPQRWHGQSVMRPVEVESSDGRVAQAAVRFGVGPSRQRAQQHAQSSAVAHRQEADAVAAHGKHVQARWFAGLPEAEAAIAAHEGRGPGRRGRRPHPWRYHTGRARRVSATRRTRRARRGRPAKPDARPTESGYRLDVEVEALGHPAAEHGWTVLATTVCADAGGEAAMLHAYQEQHTTVEPGFRWIKHPAAISPVGLETPERIAALARLTVVG